MNRECEIELSSLYHKRNSTIQKMKEDQDKQSKCFKGFLRAGGEKLDL